MYFKRLEIQGFKSFVDPTALDFEAGISAIVGPNGCGKSNVVDALRWVLGEQSAKALRGRSMEDVIFNGTDQRKAVGMAEVSLTIDNHDHLLPTEHEEVTITRRAYRSGESEYLMNKALCRLRDIHDLFMDTGIGTSAYSILEQGKIDLIVSSRPADRREVFEEAAGISKYKSRKDETLRKLESTDQNLLRVNDIAAEVKRQINSLERQVQKARRYQEFKQELTTLEVVQGKKEWKKQRHALRKVEQHWEENRLQIEESNQSKKLLEDELNLYNQQLLEIETQWNQQQNNLHQVLEEIIKNEDFISSSELRKRDLVVGIERLQAELAAQNSKEELLRSQNAGALESLARKEQELEASRSQLGQEEDRLNQLEAELKERAALVQDQQNRLLKIVDQMSTLRGILRNLEIRRGEFEQRLSKLQMQLENLTEQNQELTHENNQFESTRLQLGSHLETMRIEQTQLGNEKERLEQVQKTLTAMLESFNKTITQMTSRLAWIEELKNGLDGYEMGAKTILLEHNTNPEKLPGVIGPLVNFIRTDQKFEFAFEALLGHQLQYILMQSESEIHKAVEFLVEDNRGRATFIPADVMQQRAELDSEATTVSEAWQTLPGCLGWAKNLVRIDERFRSVFQQLLANVAIVIDRNALLQARALGATCTLVTLSGEIQTAQRWLTGGSQDITEKGILGREREIEELRIELVVLEKNLAETQSEANSTQLRLTETIGGLTTVNADIHEHEIRLAQTEKTLEGLQHQRAEVERQLQNIQEERNHIQNELNLAMAEHDSSFHKLFDLELTDKQTQAELTSHQEEIELRRQEYDERSMRAGELRVSAAACEQQLNNLNSEVGRVTTELKEIAQHKSEKGFAIQGDQQRLAELEQQVVEKCTGLQRMQENKILAEQQLEGFRAQREEVGEYKKQKEMEFRHVQTASDTSKQSLHELELEKAQMKMELKNLENYLEGEYKLNMVVDGEVEIEENSTVDQPAPETMQNRVKELKEKLAAMGSVNLVAMEEYDELQTRHEFLSKQLSDLKESKETLQRLIGRINQESRERFDTTFSQIRVKFKEVFRRLFNGGEADLVLVDETNLLETGIEIIARPPGKRLQNISLLSGGEKALTAIALLFAIFLIKPSPFCIFDEMDAPLDDTNTLRFSRILKDFAKRSQFIVITHNKVTMEAASVLYGVTMQESGVSKIVSVKFKGEEERLVEPAPAIAAEEAILN